MAIERRIKIDRIQIVGDYRRIHTYLIAEFVDTDTGVVLGRAKNISMKPKSPDDDLDNIEDIVIGEETTSVPEDVKNRLKNIAKQEWTQKVKDSWRSKNAD